MDHDVYIDMLTHTLARQFALDLAKLRKEIGLYRNEENIWKVQGMLPNSAGNLCLHLVGNLNAYIGNELGKTGYVRHRDLEFSLKNIPRAELLDMIDKTSEVISNVLNSIPEQSLSEQYPVIVLAEATTTEFFLIHLLTHLSYHLGQVNYHRRVVDVF